VAVGTGSEGSRHWSAAAYWHGMLDRAPGAVELTLPRAAHRKGRPGERFRTDRRKGNALTRGAWDLLRFPWHTLDGEPATCIAEVEATLALAGRRPA
jgi:hypothetical protein